MIFSANAWIAFCFSSAEYGFCWYLDMMSMESLERMIYEGRWKDVEEVLCVGLKYSSGKEWSPIVYLSLRSVTI